MGILKTITEEYFGDTIREEDEINIDGLDVKIISFTDNNGKKHKKGYKPKNGENLQKLLKRMIEVRGDEGDFNDIDTSDIVSMSKLFQFNETFNGDITGWNVSSVKNMSFMFSNAKSFNQPIGNWNVSNVIYIHYMFEYAESFNQPIGGWEFPKVENMSYMFCNAKSFNQPIGDWKFPNVKYMSSMFEGASSFNQDLSKWDLKGKIIIGMFYNCPIKNEYKPKME
jgi:surface protein